MEIAILIPCYNEGSSIQQVVNDFKVQLPDAKIYVYDNNSTDDTIAKATEAGAIIGREFIQGKANVVRRMFREIEADIYIMVDGDNTYPASEVHKLLDPVMDGGYFMAIGDRHSNGTYASENKRAFHNLGNNMVKFLINRLFNSRLNDIMTGYRVFNRYFVKNYPVLCQGFELETEMSIFALNNKLAIKEIPITFQDRAEGSYSKLNTFSDGRKVILTIFNLFRHYRPFFFFSIVALTGILLSLLIGYPVISEYIQYKYIYKVPSAILASGLMVMSIIVFSIGLILDTISILDKKNFQIEMNKAYSSHYKK
ncbi:MAG TPA: glycosyltransferase family 2 protein [Bacteroidales bacterium]|nr:glycosyltransferase family 2 protein [Bacteroidales bacterium]